MKLRKLFHLASKRVKYLGINLNKAAKELQPENYKILLKKTEEDANKWKTAYVHELKDLMLLDVSTTQSNLQI